MILNPAEQLDQVEDERQFDTAEVEEKITSPDSNEKILREIQKYALEHQEQAVYEVELGDLFAAVLGHDGDAP